MVNHGNQRVPSARRMQALRARRKAGTHALVPVEVLDTDLPILMARGLIRADQASDRRAVSDAIEAAFERWLYGDK